MINETNETGAFFSLWVKVWVFLSIIIHSVRWWNQHINYLCQNIFIFLITFWFYRLAVRQIQKWIINSYDDRYLKQKKHSGMRKETANSPQDTLWLYIYRIMRTRCVNQESRVSIIVSYTIADAAADFLSRLSACSFPRLLLFWSKLENQNKKNTARNIAVRTHATSIFDFKQYFN